MINAMSYTAFRNNLATVLDQVNDDHKPVLITRARGKPAVVVSLEDFQAYGETAYLMSNPKNAEYLSQSIADAEAGRVQQHDLIED